MDIRKIRKITINNRLFGDIKWQIQCGDILTYATLIVWCSDQWGMAINHESFNEIKDVVPNGLPWKWSYQGINQPSNRYYQIYLKGDEELTMFTLMHGGKTQ